MNYKQFYNMTNYYNLFKPNKYLSFGFINKISFFLGDYLYENSKKIYTKNIYYNEKNNMVEGLKNSVINKNYYNYDNSFLSQIIKKGGVNENVINNLYINKTNFFKELLKIKNRLVKKSFENYVKKHIKVNDNFHYKEGYFFNKLINVSYNSKIISRLINNRSFFDNLMKTEIRYKKTIKELQQKIYKVALKKEKSYLINNIFYFNKKLLKLKKYNSLNILSSYNHNLVIKKLFIKNRNKLTKLFINSYEKKFKSHFLAKKFLYENNTTKINYLTDFYKKELFNKKYNYLSLEFYKDYSKKYRLEKNNYNKFNLIKLFNKIENINKIRLENKIKENEEKYNIRLEKIEEKVEALKKINKKDTLNFNQNEKITISLRNMLKSEI